MTTIPNDMSSLAAEKKIACGFIDSNPEAVTKTTLNNTLHNNILLYRNADCCHSLAM